MAKDKKGVQQPHEHAQRKAEQQARDAEALAAKKAEEEKKREADRKAAEEKAKAADEKKVEGKPIPRPEFPEVELKASYTPEQVGKVLVAAGFIEAADPADFGARLVRPPEDKPYWSVVARGHKYQVPAA